MNPDWQSGLGSSIVVGIRQAMSVAPDLEAAVVLTCDQPFVGAAALTQLIELRAHEWQANRRIRLRGDSWNSCPV